MPRRWFGVVSSIAADTWRRAQGHDLMLIAAGLALYAGIAIVPLLLLGLYAAGLVVGAQQAIDLVERVSALAPPTMGLRQTVRTLGAIGPNLAVPSLIASIIAATTYGEGMLRAVDAIEGARRPIRSVAGRLRALPYVGVFPFVTVAGLLTVATLPDLAGGGTTGQVLGVYLTFWTGWLAATVLLIVLYRLFSARPLRWAATVWGALATGSFLVGMSLGWVVVLRYGIAVGQAFGGSEEVGRVVLLAIYLLLVQAVVLVGHLLIVSIDAYLTTPAPEASEQPGPLR